MHIEIDNEHRIRTRDGTILSGTLYRASGSSRSPTIVVRTPYGKDRFNAEYFNALTAVAAGFSVYIQDIRGFFSSTGLPQLADWPAEASDTLDTFEALSDHSWSDGRFGMAGSSYMGMLTIAASSKKVAALQAIAPTFVSDGRAERIGYGGAIRLEETVALTCQFMIQSELKKTNGNPRDFSEHGQLALQCMSNMDKFFEELRVQRGSHKLLDFEQNQLSSWLAGRSSPFDGLELNSSQATLLTSGTFDTFFRATAEMLDFSRLGSDSFPESIIGPWTHSNALTSTIGAFNFGAAASGAGSQVSKKQTNFFERVFFGSATEAINQRFVLFENRWVDCPPPASRKVIEFAAESNFRNIILRADKNSLCPSIGGQRSFVGGGTSGPFDLRSLLDRQDARLIEFTAIGPLTIFGSLKARAKASATSEIGLFAKLCLKSPDGAVFPIQEGFQVLKGPEIELTFKEVYLRVPSLWKACILATLGDYPRFLSPTQFTDPEKQEVCLGDWALLVEGHLT